MQLDQKMLNRLLTMNDEQLTAFIKRIATDSGIDPSLLGLTPDSIQSIRQMLGNTTESDLAGFQAIYDTYTQNKRRQ